MNLIFIHGSKYDSFCYFNSFLVNLHAPNSYIAQQTPCYGRWAGSLPFFSNLLGNSWILKRKGFFHSIQNSRNFGWYIKWNRFFWFGPTGIFGTRFEGGPLWLVWSFQSVGLKSPFPFDEMVVTSTALLFPAYKNNNWTRRKMKWSSCMRTY